MKIQGLRLGNFFKLTPYIVGGLLGLLFGSTGSTGWSHIGSPIFQAIAISIVLLLYVNSRRRRRSINLHSEAILSIEAESNVAWQVLDVGQEVIKEGIGQARFSVPVNVSYMDSSLLFFWIPENWRLSRWFSYKQRMMYSYVVLSQNASDVIACQLELGQHLTREESVEGEAYLCLFLMDPIHSSRHWIWPDWFEMFSDQRSVG